MNHSILTGVIIVNIALVFYTIAFTYVQRTKAASKRMLLFLTLGVACDLTSTAFMVAGSTHSFISTHGLLGYSSLLGMLTDCYLMWSLVRKKGANTAIGKPLHLYTKVAYLWWIIAYIAGVAIVAAR